MSKRNVKVIRKLAENIVDESISQTNTVYLSHAVKQLKSALIFEGIDWKDDAELEEAIQDAWAKHE